MASPIHPGYLRSEMAMGAGRRLQWPDFVIHLPGKRYVEMERLDDLEAFVAIIEKGSQAAASRHLRRPLQSLNCSLMALDVRSA